MSQEHYIKVILVGDGYVYVYMKHYKSKIVQLYDIISIFLLSGSQSMHGLFGETVRWRAPVMRHGTNNAKNL